MFHNVFDFTYSVHFAGKHKKKKIHDDGGRMVKEISISKCEVVSQGLTNDKVSDFLHLDTSFKCLAF